MKKGDAKPPSQRQLRVGEEVRHALAWILERGEIRDPGLGRVAITVTEVRISPDLRNATAFVVPLGGGNGTDVIDALNRAAPFVRRKVGKTVKLRRLPNLNFVADTTFDEAEHIDDLLKDPSVSRDLDPNDSRGGDQGGNQGNKENGA